MVSEKIKMWKANDRQRRRTMDETWWRPGELKSLNRFWTLTENSEHSEHWLKILNRFWTLCTWTEQSLKSLNIDWKFWTFLTLSEQSLNILPKYIMWYLTYFKITFLKSNYNKYIISFLIKFVIFFISIFLLKSICFSSFSLDFN